MGIIYVISVIALIFSFILIKKTEKKINLFSFINITIGILFCYNVIISYILTFFKLPVNLVSLSIINIIIAGILILIIIRKKEIQKFEVHKIDFLYISILGIAVIIVSYLNFGMPLNIKYETGDPSVHYITSRMFSDGDSLLGANKSKDEIFGTLNTRKTTSYVNSGLIMECFNDVADSFYNYKIFIIFGILILFLTASSMYTTISNFATDWKTRLLAFIVSLIYTLGYPLNSLLFGFEYMSMGLLLICLIFDMVYYFENKELKLGYIITIFALFNFGLFSAYYMFVPFIYSALWIYFCIYSHKKEKSIFKKKNIILLITTLIIPFLLGFIYFMIPNIYRTIIDSGLKTENILNLAQYYTGKGIETRGYIYTNLYSNMLLLLPIPIYMYIKKFKENRYGIINAIFCILFIFILLVGFRFDKVSLYYLSKNYFVLWFILFYLNYKGLIEIYSKYPKIVFGIIVGYILLIIIPLITVNTPIIPNYGNANEKITNVTEIFGVNKTILKEKQTDLNKEQIELIKYFKDNISYESKTEVVGSSEQLYWVYALTGYVNDNDKLIYSGQIYLEDKYEEIPININNADYIIYFKDTYMYNNHVKDRINELGEILIENSSGGIIKCNK